MSHLPPGWTEARLRSATVTNLRTLPQDTLHKLDPRMVEDDDVRSAIVKAQIAESQSAERARLGLAPKPSKPVAAQQRDQFVQVVEDAGFEDFGFFLFRTDYTDEVRWETWQKEYDRLLEASMDGCDGVERVRERLLTPLVDDPRLQGASWNAVVGYFEDCKEHGQVSPGLDLSMCLALDHDAVSSLLEPVQGQAPWVWAVDVHHDFQTPDSAVQEYPGYFKVAISSLIPDLYPMLAGPHMQPRELWPLAKPISMSAVG